jgi:hypothetical protein
MSGIIYFIIGYVLGFLTCWHFSRQYQFTLKKRSEAEK